MFQMFLTANIYDLNYLLNVIQWFCTPYGQLRFR